MNVQKLSQAVANGNGLFLGHLIQSMGGAFSANARMLVTAEGLVNGAVVAACVDHTGSCLHLHSELHSLVDVRLKSFK